jgi:hypothetical protein
LQQGFAASRQGVKDLRPECLSPAAGLRARFPSSSLAGGRRRGRVVLMGACSRIGRRDAILR